MADEINLTAAIAFAKAGTTYPSGNSNVLSVGQALSELQFDVSGTTYVSNTISVGTSAEAVPLGEVTAPHWAMFWNLDPTNFIKIRNGSVGADLVKMLAGEPALFPLYNSATPYVIADTAACLMWYLIISL